MLKNLKLVSFRNHQQMEVELNNLTIIVGKNAVGKTNILEAVSLLSTGESFRAKKIEEMVRWGEEVGHVICKIENFAKAPSNNQNEYMTLQVTVTRGVVQGRRVMKRLFKVNGTGKHKPDFVGLLPTVLFSPEEMSLLTGEPRERRKFLDQILVQVDKEYGRSLMAYEKALVRRNKLLDLLREGQVNRTALTFWDQLLIKEGNVLTRKREALAEWINAVPAREGELFIEYDRSTISEARLKEHEAGEIALGYTLVGPHKDDFRVKDRDRDLAIYGSRGEQRMAVMWLLEAQLNVMEKLLGGRPLLLLDDILSELDQEHEEDILELANQQQTVITTTEEKLVSKLVEAKIVKI